MVFVVSMDPKHTESIDNRFNAIYGGDCNKLIFKGLSKSQHFRLFPPPCFTDFPPGNHLAVNFTRFVPPRANNAPPPILPSMA